MTGVLFSVKAVSDPQDTILILRGIAPCGQHQES